MPTGQNLRSANRKSFRSLCSERSNEAKKIAEAAHEGDGLACKGVDLAEYSGRRGMSATVAAVHMNRASSWDVKWATAIMGEGEAVADATSTEAHRASPWRPWKG